MGLRKEVERTGKIIEILHEMFDTHHKMIHNIMKINESLEKKFANKTGLKITVCHFPPGTSKWNKIEHRMFSFISMNWRGKPLTNYELIINLIENTTTKKGLKITAKMDRKIYELGKKILEKEFNKINIKEHEINPEWNYTLSKI